MASRPKRSGRVKAMRIKVRGSDLDSMAEIVASLMRSGGGVAEIIADLFAEGRRKRPRDAFISGYVSLLVNMLGDLRVSANGGDTNAPQILAEARRTLDAEIAKGGVEPGVLLIVAKAFAQAGLDPGTTLQNAMDAMMRARPIEELAPDTADLTEHLREMAAGFDNDPFALHLDVAETAVAFPPEHRGTFVHSLAESDVAPAREAAVGFVLSAEAATGAEAVRALLSASANKPVSAATVSRLVRMRPWLSGSRRDVIDGAIKALRLKAEAPLGGPMADVQSMFTSLSDGAGACGLFSVAKRERRFVLCSVLIKAELGVVDAFATGGLSRREVDGLVERMANEGGAYEVSRSFYERRLADALATNVARDAPPPFGLVQVAETLSLGQIHPLAMESAALVEELLADLPTKQKDKQAAQAAHLASTMWARQVDTVTSWFEAGEEIDRLLAPLKSRAQRVESVLNTVLPAHRASWASRCSWAAATLKEGTDDADMFGALWAEFALVARDLASDMPIGAIPLMRQIAAITVQVFGDRPRG